MCDLTSGCTSGVAEIVEFINTWSKVGSLDDAFNGVGISPQYDTKYEGSLAVVDDWYAVRMTEDEIYDLSITI
jgi:hypothetical protein